MKKRIAKKASKKRGRGRPLKYGEPLVTVTIRIPQSLYERIKHDVSGEVIRAMSGGE